MRTFEIVAGCYLLIFGIAVIVTWVVLLAGDGVPNIEQDLFSLIFHWSSEALLALLSIAVGAGLLRYSELARRTLFFDLGLAVCSTLNALYYYAGAAPGIVFSILLAVSLVFFIIAYQSYRFTTIPSQQLFKFGLFNLGLFSYLGLNVAGEYGQSGNWAVLCVSVFLVIVALSILMRLVRSAARSSVLQVVAPGE